MEKNKQIAYGLSFSHEALWVFWKPKGHNLS